MAVYDVELEGHGTVVNHIGIDGNITINFSGVSLTFNRIAMREGRGSIDGVFHPLGEEEHQNFTVPYQRIALPRSEPPQSSLDKMITLIEALRREDDLAKLLYQRGYDIGYRSLISFLVKAKEGYN